MSKLLLSGVAAAALVVALNGPGLAADLAIRKAPAMQVAGCEWCGFYFGGNLGYGWSRSALDNAVNEGVGSRLSGLSVGLHSGYNWQQGQWVFGLESDGMITPWERTYLEPRGGQDTQTRRRIDWLSSIRGRLGFAFDRNLIYATGGVAWVSANTTQNSTSTFKNVRFDTTGYVVGGGIERKLSSNVSIRLEGLHYVFNKVRTHTASTEFETSTLTDKLRDVTVIRTGVSWHLN
jgi:outer membrane immunogenic protein